MVKVVLISKNCDVKNKNVMLTDLDLLYKKCGFNSSEDFERRHTWSYSGSYLSLYSKNIGKARTENKYDCPPPCDKPEDLYFGTLVIIKHSSEEPDISEIENLEVSQWETFYDVAFGGFESLGDEDSSDDELEEIPKEMKTKDGYLKDGFVVDTASSDDDCLPQQNDNSSSESDASECETEDDELSEESYISSDED